MTLGRLIHLFQKKEAFMKKALLVILSLIITTGIVWGAEKKVIVGFAQNELVTLGG